MTSKYAVCIGRTPTGFSAHVPDLQGCVATGATLEETERCIREAIEVPLAGMREDGDPIPEPSTIAEMVVVTVPSAA